MSLWLSETKTTGLWKGGLWKSQQGSPYAFNLDLSTFKDTVTGQSLSCNIDGTRYDEVDGVTTAFTTDVPTIADKGLRTVGTYTNYCLYSQDFTNSYWTTNNVSITEQNKITVSSSNDYARIYHLNITLPYDTKTIATVYVKACFATIQFYMRLSAGTQTTLNYTPVAGNNFSVKNTSDYTKQSILVYLNPNGDSGRPILGDFLKANLQLSRKKYALPYVPTTTAPISSPSEAGNSSTGTGIWIDDVASNFPLLNTALTSQGTLTFKWKTGFNDADVSGNLNILSFDGTTDSAIFYDADNNLIKITDGTNTASKALTVVADTEYTIQATWGLVSGSPKMQIAVNGTAGTQADFTGTFTPSDIYFGLENEELQYIKDFMVYKEATWL